MPFWVVSAAAVTLLTAGGLWSWSEYRRANQVRGAAVRIGVEHNPPMYDWSEQKGATGFAVDVMNEAARRAGVTVQWVYCERGSRVALESRHIDLWPAGFYRPGEYAALHQTRPWSRDQHAFVFDKGRLAEAPEQLEGVRVAVINRMAPLALAGRLFPRSRIVPAPSRRDVLRTMCVGAADVSFMDMRTVKGMLLDRPEQCRDKTLLVKPLPEFIDPTSIFAWKDHGAVADVMRDRIDDMVADGTLMRFADRWLSFASSDVRHVLGLQEQARQLRWLGGVCVVMGMAIALMTWLIAKLRSARSSAERARHLQSEFLANVSHEIRTPMNGVLGTADLLLETVENAEMREQVETIRESAYGQLELLNQILDQSKIDSGLLLLETTPFSPRKLLEQVEKTFLPMARRKGVALRAVVDGDVPALVQGDGLRIRQVLTNLVNNAIKFTKDGSVEVGLRAEGSGALVRLGFSVQDTGIGIPRELQGSIFEKFRQVDASTTRKYGGTGLGLSISRQLVRLMGGELTLESELGQGSRFGFQVELPVARASAGETRAGVVKGQMLTGLVVLVVEDNIVNQKVAAGLLKRLGATVELAANGVEAVAKCREKEYDVVLMDCHMPEMDGYAATMEIRKMDGAVRHLPIVALTAGVSGEERLKALQAGMDGFLAKPVNREELASTLAAFPRRDVPAE